MGVCWGSGSLGQQRRKRRSEHDVGDGTERTNGRVRRDPMGDGRCGRNCGVTGRWVGELGGVGGGGGERSTVHRHGFFGRDPFQN